MRKVLLFLVIIFFGFLSSAQAENDKIDKWNRYIEANPRSAAAYNNRGNAYGRLKQYARAIQDFDKAIELSGPDAQTYNNRGVAHFFSGRKDRGCADLKKACVLGNCYVLDRYTKKRYCP